MWIQVYGGANEIARIELLNRSYDIFSVQNADQCMARNQP